MTQNSNALTTLADIAKLKKALQVMDVFKKTETIVDLQTMVTFLTVATMLGERGGDSLFVGEVSEALGVKPGVGSRSVRYLTKNGSKVSNKEGPDWIRLEVDPQNLARKHVIITAKGKRALESLTSLFE